MSALSTSAFMYGLVNADIKGSRVKCSFTLLQRCWSFGVYCCIRCAGLWHQVLFHIVAAVLGFQGQLLHSMCLSLGGKASDLTHCCSGVGLSGSTVAFRVYALALFLYTLMFSVALGFKR